MKGGHKKVIQLLENWTSSLDSASHPATNNSRLLLSMNGSDLHKDYSTASTFETGVSPFNNLFLNLPHLENIKIVVVYLFMKKALPAFYMS